MINEAGLPELYCTVNYFINKFIGFFIYNLFFRICFEPVQRSFYSCSKRYFCIKAGYELFNFRVIKNNACRFVTQQAACIISIKLTDEIRCNMNNIRFYACSSSNIFIYLVASPVGFDNLSIIFLNAVPASEPFTPEFAIVPKRALNDSRL